MTEMSVRFSISDSRVVNLSSKRGIHHLRYVNDTYSTVPKNSETRKKKLSRNLFLSTFHEHMRLVRLQLRYRLFISESTASRWRAGHESNHADGGESDYEIKDTGGTEFKQVSTVFSHFPKNCA